ncbi:helix-turn-helix domain-containing protein [Halostagnicola kamekurae]|uniref:Predicted DNA binding protein, contains HTH domain n=1 Tax=Halostagnicola kamekurae TaxID=619731 RepID=A0A1I6SWC2_9EURY|nr:helix-turn-helix domain-containing protein [Halostagnicola kamekurae]SFS81162.1 Predicted DNA binding protein, contains HTH domain [Halostagnicola kamekurae]
MTTVVELDVPAEHLGFAQTFDRVPTFEFLISGLIGGGPPLVYVTGPDWEQIESALESDPSADIVASVDDASDGRWVVRLEFNQGIQTFQRIVSEHDGAILEASGADGRWSLKLLFHERADVSECHAAFDEEDFGVRVTRVSPMDDSPDSQTPLTKTQYETIVKAHELGYFDVPRQVTLEELASELDISHQALSERLRRSHSALVSAELSNRIAPTGLDS